MRSAQPECEEGDGEHTWTTVVNAKQKLKGSCRAGLVMENSTKYLGSGEEGPAREDWTGTRLTEEG